MFAKPNKQSFHNYLIYNTMLTTENLDPKTVTVGEIVAQDIHAAEVFKRLGIDFCCNGKQTLTDACQRAKVSLALVLSHLNQNSSAERLPSEQFTTWPLDFLGDYILNVHHRYLYQNLPFIDELVQKVAGKHGGQYPGLLIVRQLFADLHTDLLAHLQKEEVALFPFIKQLSAKADQSADRSFSLEAPIHCMEHEHDNAGTLLLQLRKSTDNYTPPIDACNSHRLMLAKLAELEADLMQHIHLENNILFPKALALA